MTARTSPRRAPRPPSNRSWHSPIISDIRTDPESVKALPNGAAWLASVERVDEKIRHLSIHRGHNLDISNGHDALLNVSAAKQMTFTGTREVTRTSRSARGPRRHWHHLRDCYDV